MKKIIMAILCLLLSWNAAALEIADVNLPDNVSLGDQTLVLNGAGIRTRFFFKVYVAALYLLTRQKSESAVIADENPQRIALYMVRGLSEKTFLHAFIEAIEANQTPAEMTALGDRIKQMSDIFHFVGEVKKGDVITLDYQPSIGTQIGVNGVTQGTVVGEQFHRALLKIWLGEHAVQDDLKKDMLGG